MNEPRPRNPLTWVLLGLVWTYQQVVSPWLPRTCKYYPSCSSYAVTALRTHGALKGAALSGWRLLRCNPWSLGGVDHVPARGRWRSPDRTVDVAAGAHEDGRTDHGARPHTLDAGTRGARTAAATDL